MPNLITAHVTDARGVYQRTEELDRYGPQPEYASYADLPDVEEGFTRVWIVPAWQQIPDEDVPSLPWPKGPVPASCSRRQGRLALLGIGKLDEVENAIAAIEDPIERRAAQIEYEADTWERSNAFLCARWAALGGTEAQLDDLFRTAVTL